MKRVVGYVAAFLCVSAASGGIAFAASNYVQAKYDTSTVVVNGKTVATPTKLLYGGTTYVQLYSIELGLRQAGMNPRWDGHTFSMQGSTGLSTTEFVTQVKMVIKAESADYNELSRFNLQHVTPADHTTLAAVSGRLSILQNQVTGWAVTTDSERQVKTLFLQGLTTMSNACNLANQSIASQLSGNIKMAADRATAAAGVIQLYSLMKNQLAGSLVKYGVSLPPYPQDPISYYVQPTNSVLSRTCMVHWTNAI